MGSTTFHGLNFLSHCQNKCYFINSISISCIEHNMYNLIFTYLTLSPFDLNRIVYIIIHNILMIYIYIHKNKKITECYTHMFVCRLWFCFSLIIIYRKVSNGLCVNLTFLKHNILYMYILIYNMSSTRLNIICLYIWMLPSMYDKIYSMTSAGVYTCTL